MNIALSFNQKAAAEAVMPTLRRSNFVSMTSLWKHRLHPTNFLEESETIWGEIKPRWDEAIANWHKLTGDLGLGNHLFLSTPLDLLWRISAFSGPDIVLPDMDSMMMDLAGAIACIDAIIIIIARSKLDSGPMMLWLSFMCGMAYSFQGNDEELFFVVDTQSSGIMLPQLTEAMNIAFAKTMQSATAVAGAP